MEPKGGLLAIPNNGSVALYWSSPSDTSDIDEWQYRYKPKSSTESGYTDWTDIANSGATTTSTTVGSLTNGTTYTFQVRAIDSDDDIVGSVLGSPTAAPSTTGGWTNIANSGANTTSYTVTGLTSNTAYAFQLRATSAAGNGLPSDISGAAYATPPAKPTEPTTITLAETFNGSGLTGSFTITVSWTKPTDTTIDGYQYRYAETLSGLSSATWTDIAGSSYSTKSHDVAGFKAGATRLFQVRAFNEAGPGTASNIASVTLAPAKPVVSISKTFTGQGFTVGMTWPKLQRNGSDDSSIAYWQYRGVYGNMGVSDSVLTTELKKKAWKTISKSGVNTVSLTFKDMASPRYAFQVRAVNVAASGPASDVKLVTLSPAAPSGFKVNVTLAPEGSTSGGTAKLEWTKTTDASIQRYEYRQSASETAKWKKIPSCSCDLQRVFPRVPQAGRVIRL